MTDLSLRIRLLEAQRDNIIYSISFEDSSPDQKPRIERVRTAVDDDIA